jgi:hypothetical protein
MSHDVKPIRENPPVDRIRRTAMSDGKATSYLIPDQKCATCGRSSREAMHWDCRRDLKGRLLVVSR